MYIQLVTNSGDRVNIINVYWTCDLFLHKPRDNDTSEIALIRLESMSLTLMSGVFEQYRFLR